MYQSGNLNTDTNSVCVDGHYEFLCNFNSWSMSPDFDLNNANELRIYSIAQSSPLPGDMPLVAYFTRTNPYQTPVGTDVAVDLGGGVSAQFDTVTAGGTTTVSSSSHPYTPHQTGFKYGTPGHYLSFSTTATFSGDVTICINYDPSTIVGNESNLKISQFDSGWTDITTSLDTGGNILCGKTSNF